MQDFGLRLPLGEILIENEIITEEQLQEALDEQSDSGVALGEILKEKEYATDQEVLHALATQAGMEIIDLDSIKIEPEVISLIAGTMASIYQIVPVSNENGVLTVAMADPSNVSALDDLRFMLSIPDIVGVVADPEAIERLIDEHYSSDGNDMNSLLDEFGEDGFQELEDGDSNDLDANNLEAMADSAPVVKLMNLILLTAIRDQAADIHLEPFEDEFRIRYRIDGVLLEMTPPPKELALALVSRVKVMAGMDIAETRVPQDNRIELSVSGNPIDLRVATLPTMFGESIVMRILDRSVVSLDIERIGLREDEVKNIRNLIARPNGIILVTGPTGSGKTTTLYSCLSEANDIGTKLITTEDPVEYDIDGIIQVPIDDDIGVTYSACLRAILRQDPDKILVGEIRDKETAMIAIEAALTGHVVFSTLHTNDAPSTISRLLNMDIESFLLAATVEAIVAQRLIRLICTKCKEEYEPTEEMLREVQLKPEDTEGRTFYYGKGCEACNKTGYKGRNAIFEIMMMNTRLRNLILENVSTQVLRAEAQGGGMRNLRQAGILKILDGLTTIEEVTKETLSFD